MLETAEVGRELRKEVFEKEAPKIREELLDVQRQLLNAGFPVIIIISGNEGAGKGETVNLLLEWMDARGIEVNAFWKSTDEEEERPRFWRYWRVLPPKGRLGIFFGSWYTAPIIGRVFKKIDKEQFELDLDQIVGFERMLSNEGALILKFWLHLSEKAQKRRLKKLEKDPETRWRVTKLDWKFLKRYDKFRKVSEKALSKTNIAEAPWQIIEAEDSHYRHLTVAKAILNACKSRLEKMKISAGKNGNAPDLLKPSKVNILNQLDSNKALGQKAYESHLLDYQGKLNRLTRKLNDEKRSLILVFEGNDAAGKGGTIRRLVWAIDSRIFRVIPVAAPTDEERAHPYLWRFWRHLPLPGQVTIFDRSWYGRVLVERIEGFCSKDAWQRAYSEINDFEGQLTDFGIVLLKFWLAIDKDEQMKRFKQREETSWKRYKITQEDWRNREKWDAYEAAACDMIEKTGTDDAPWVLVESNNKLYGRIKVIKSVVERLEKELG